MNIHHMELFYYVARHGGISRAVRYMPYSIQQPAISSQIAALEQNLGTKLFKRTPFELTGAGAELFAFVQPFFANIETTAAKLRKATVPLLRVGAVDLVLHDHFQSVTERLRALHPRVRLELRSGFTPQLEACCRIARSTSPSRRWRAARRRRCAAYPCCGCPWCCSCPAR